MARVWVRSDLSEADACVSAEAERGGARTVGLVEEILLILLRVMLCSVDDKIALHSPETREFRMFELHTREKLLNVLCATS